MAIAAIVLGVGALVALRTFRPGSSPGTAAMDVNTMIGQRAPAFSLPDAFGAMRRVVPGQGRPIVLISHMGFF
ncbi:MAG: hypothetical protein ACRDF1_09800 [bacterium]